MGVIWMIWAPLKRFCQHGAIVSGDYVYPEDDIALYMTNSGEYLKAWISAVVAGYMFIVVSGMLTCMFSNHDFMGWYRSFTIMGIDNLVTRDKA